MAIILVFARDPCTSIPLYVPSIAKSVNINDIFPTQRSLNINNLKKVEKTTKNTGAYLLKNNGKYYVLDGHHRIAINILNGIDKIDAFVFKNH